MTTIILVSHSKLLAEGLIELIHGMVGSSEYIEVVSASGLVNQELGTSTTPIIEGIQNASDGRVYIFYDIGSAKMSSELAMELTGNPSKVSLFDVAFVEGAFTASVMAHSGLEHAEIVKELDLIRKP